jgi:F-type H+-transporting ATPase subunit gamma
MPALIDVRRRIRSVKSTQQITKAMKMVSAAKLRRAQEAMFAARPYARKMLEVLNDLATRAQPSAHPLLREHGSERALLVVVTADKGLCGAFNANILRTATRFIEQRGQTRQIELELVGRKARDFFRRRRFRIRAEHVGVFHPLRYQAAKELSAELVRCYSAAEFDEVFLLYNEFKSVIQQRVVLERLLPIERLRATGPQAFVDYVYEPGPAEIFAELLPKHIETQVWRALLESAAAEHGARMAAMDAATNNAAEMIERLTLHMNKVRQAAITTQIIEIVSGAGSPA